MSDGRVYEDQGGELWLDPGGGGEGDGLLSLDSQLLRVLREKWGTVSREAVEAKFGPLRQLAAGGEPPLPRGKERWPLLAVGDGQSEKDCADVAVKVAARARDAADARILLEACGLREYEKGTVGGS